MDVCQTSRPTDPPLLVDDCQISQIQHLILELHTLSTLTFASQGGLTNHGHTHGQTNSHTCKLARRHLM